MHLGEQWNDDADGHMSGEGQSHLDHGDMNNSARGRPLLLLTQVNNKKVEIKKKKLGSGLRVCCWDWNPFPPLRDRHVEKYWRIDPLSLLSSLLSTVSSLLVFLISGLLDIWIYLRYFS